jgi:hypothetical protein
VFSVEEYAEGLTGRLHVITTITVGDASAPRPRPRTVTQQAGFTVTSCRPGGSGSREVRQMTGPLADQAASFSRRLRAWERRAPTVPRWICMISAISFCLKRSK